MTTYKIEPDFNQDFIIDYNGEKVTLRLRYIPLNHGWYVSIPDIVNGIKVSLGLPILASYGYGNIYFIKKNTGVDWLGEMDDVYIVVLTDEEVEDVLLPAVVMDEMGIRVV